MAVWSMFVKEAFQKTVFVAKFFSLLHVTHTYVCTPVIVEGPSMLPTFQITGDLVISEHISTMFGKVGRGDIVIARSPENPRKLITKRVKGMEGDEVTYTVDPKNSDRCVTVVVPKGHVWLEGDNVNNTSDSRKFGAVPYGLIEGRIFWRFWPPEGFGSLDKKGRSRYLGKFGKYPEIKILGCEKLKSDAVLFDFLAFNFAKAVSL